MIHLVMSSQKIVGVLGVLVALAFAVTVRSFAETLGTDAAEVPYVGLWIYTPYVEPGDRVAVKVFLQGGDRIFIKELHARIDGTDAIIENRNDRERNSGKRFDMGKMEIELHAVVPADLPHGEHVLGFDVATDCTGSDFSKACGKVAIEAPIQVGDSFVGKLLAALRALGAAGLAFFVFRRGWDPLMRWVRAGEKSAGAILAPTFIVVLVVWAWSAYPLFARPLGAAFGSSSDVLYATAIVGWLAILPTAVRTRRRPLRGGTRVPPTEARVVFLSPGDGAAVPGTTDYRAPAPRAQTSLATIATVLSTSLSVRYRRSGDRLFPRWFHGAPVTFRDERGDGGIEPCLRMTGDRGYILIFVALFAAKLGALRLTLDGTTIVVESDDTASAVKAKLEAPPAARASSAG